MTDILNQYYPKGIKKDIITYIRKAYNETVCANGIYPSPSDRDRVWKYFNEVADKIINKKI